MNQVSSDFLSPSSPNVLVGDLEKYLPSKSAICLDSRLRHAGMTMMFLVMMGVASQFSFAADPIWVSQFEPVKRETRLNRRPRMDATGNLVVFESTISSTKRHASKQKYIYLYNRTTKFLKKIAGSVPGTLNGEPFISGNGEVVSFQAYTRNSAPSLPPPKADLFLYTIKSDQYKLLTPGWNDVVQDGECSGSFLSFDGKKIVFSSNATNLSSTTVTSLPRIYSTNTDDISIRLMSVNSEGKSANRLSGDARLTQQNNVLFYKSAATNLIPNTPLSDLSFHLYELDPVYNTLILLDDSAAFPDWKKYSLGSYDINQDGTTIVVEGHLKSGDDPAAELERTDLFLLDRAGNKIRRISTGALTLSAHEPSISADGRYVAFSFRGLSVKRDDRGVIVYDCQTNNWRKIYNGSGFQPRISADGKWVAFETTAKRTPNRPDAMDIFLMRNTLIAK